MESSLHCTIPIKVSGGSMILDRGPARYIPDCTSSKFKWFALALERDNLELSIAIAANWSLVASEILRDNPEIPLDQLLLEVEERYRRA